MRLDDVIGRLATGIAVVGALLVAVTAAALATPAARERLGFVSPAYATGGHVDVPRGTYDGARYTLVVFARSSCAACQRAAPLFRDLITAAKANPTGRVRLVTGAPAAPAELEFARALGLDVNEVVATDLQSLRLKRVPTILLVDGHGGIHYAREGAIPASLREDILQSMTSLAR